MTFQSTDCLQGLMEEIDRRPLPRKKSVRSLWKPPCRLPLGLIYRLLCNAHWRKGGGGSARALSASKLLFVSVAPSNELAAGGSDAAAPGEARHPAWWLMDRIRSFLKNGVVLPWSPKLFMLVKSTFPPNVQCANFVNLWFVKELLTEVATQHTCFLHEFFLSSRGDWKSASGASTRFPDPALNFLRASDPGLYRLDPDHEAARDWIAIYRNLDFSIHAERSQLSTCEQHFHSIWALHSPNGI